MAPFADMRPACSNADAAQLDSTSGLRASGAYQLEADCAETATTTVDGVEAYWVRGRLEETLPPDPARVLPEVESIRLSTTIARVVRDASGGSARDRTRWRSGTGCGTGVAAVDGVAVRVVDATGVPLDDVDVGNVATADTRRHRRRRARWRCGSSPGQPNTIVVALGRFEQEHVFTPDPHSARELTFTLDMLAVRPGASPGSPRSTSVSRSSRSGLQPQPGAAFYFTHEEAFSKPGRAAAALRPAGGDAGPGADVPRERPTRTRCDHVVSWEYWNGQAWVLACARRCTADHRASPRTSAPAALIELTVPSDLSCRPRSPSSQARWMRARLVSGGYGFVKTVTIAGAGQPTTDLHVLRRAAAGAGRLPARLHLAGRAPSAGAGAHVQRLPRTRTAPTRRSGRAAPSSRSRRSPTPPRRCTSGFDGKLPVDDLGLFFDVVEQRGELAGPTLVWEYWDGFDWRRLLVEDETRHLRVPGVVSFIGPDDSRAARALRRPPGTGCGPASTRTARPGEPTMRAIHANAVWAVQRQTITERAAGHQHRPAGPGVPRSGRLPILPGQQIEVRELQGPRADVEWRILATGLFADPRALQDLETQLAADGTQTEMPPRAAAAGARPDQAGDRGVGALGRAPDAVRLRTRPTGTTPSTGLAAGCSSATASTARVPPAGAAVAARRYRTGGGAAGNVPARAISQAARPDRRSRGGLQPGAGRGRRRRRDRRAAAAPRSPRGAPPRARGHRRGLRGAGPRGVAVGGGGPGAEWPRCRTRAPRRAGSRW